MNGPRDASGAKQPATLKTVKPPVPVRRQQLLDDIALQRSELQESARTLIGPLRTIDRFRQGARQRRQWLYPAAPIFALLTWRLRPRLASLPGVAARAFAVWRIVKHFR